MTKRLPFNSLVDYVFVCEKGKVKVTVESVLRMIHLFCKNKRLEFKQNI